MLGIRGDVTALIGPHCFKFIDLVFSKSKRVQFVNPQPEPEDNENCERTNHAPFEAGKHSFASGEVFRRPVILLGRNLSERRMSTILVAWQMWDLSIVDGTIRL